MLAEERKNEILNLIASRKIIKVSELSSLLNATEATIRRDLDELQKCNKIQRVHGGAISTNPTSKVLTNNVLSAINMPEKKAIAKKAYEYIADNDSIILDASTTVLELAKLIAEGDRKDLFIVTNSFSVVSVFSNKKDVQVLHIGGLVKYNMNFAIGSIAENTLKNLRVDKCFLGINGIDTGFGYSVPSFDDAEIKKRMLEVSKQKYILADHTKFNETYFGKVVDFKDVVDFLITDYFPSELNREFYESNVNLIVADKIED